MAAVTFVFQPTSKLETKNLKPKAMKQILIVFSFIVLGLSQSKANETPIPSVVLQSFFKTFSKASDVSWEQTNGFTVAAFTMDGHKQYAYYNDANELVVTAEPISSESLPDELQSDLKASYSKYLVVDVYRFKIGNEISYRAVVENSKRKIFLQSFNNTWDEARLIKK